MASEKQLRANRENAKRSTGPKTPAGRLRSSQNALRHGLSRPLASDPAASMKAHQMAELLVAEAGDMQVMAAVEMALAQAQLLRVAAVRSTLLASLELANLDFAGATLKQLAALERYERQSLNQRRRAARMLSETPVDEDRR
jgi:hypothetical protein